MPAHGYSELDQISLRTLTKDFVIQWWQPFFPTITPLGGGFDPLIVYFISLVQLYT